MGAFYRDDLASLRKVDIRLPGNWEFKLPWRKAGLLISMIKWTRTSRLSIKISLSLFDCNDLAPSRSSAGSVRSSPTRDFDSQVV